MAEENQIKMELPEVGDTVGTVEVTAPEAETVVKPKPRRTKETDASKLRAARTDIKKLNMELDELKADLAHHQQKAELYFKEAQKANEKLQQLKHEYNAKLDTIEMSLKIAYNAANDMRG